MLTTLTQRLLTGAIPKYKFFNKKLHIFIDIEAGHAILGEVNVNLANIQSLNVYNNQTLIENFFNGTFKFEAISDTRLESIHDITSGFEPSLNEIDLDDNGEDEILITVDNIVVKLPAGEYVFKLIDTEISNFDNAKITLKEKNIAKIGESSLDGVEDIFSENTFVDVDSKTYQTIDNQELTFDFTAVVGLLNKGDDTNIPLLINNR